MWSGRLKKYVVKRRLKRARYRVANSKTRTEVRLRGTMNFHADVAAFGERLAYRAESKLRSVAIPTEMSEDDALDFAGKQLLDYARGGVIRQMPMARLDALLHRPRSMLVVLQKFLVVVRFDDQGVHFTQSFDQHFGGVTEIGDKTKAARASVKHKSDGIDCVMRHGKCLHENVADRKFRAGAKDSPISMSIQGAIAADRFGSERICVNRGVEPTAKNFQTVNVIAMFVGKQDAIELLGRDSALLEPENNLPRAQPPIDQNFAVIGRHESAIPCAATSEHGQTEHASI
jgi:hypothetical protein